MSGYYWLEKYIQTYLCQLKSILTRVPQTLVWACGWGLPTMMWIPKIGKIALNLNITHIY